MGQGIAGLMTGAGAGEGLQALLKQRLLERQMALQEQQAQAQQQQHAAELAMQGSRNKTQDEWQRLQFERSVGNDVAAAARQKQNDLNTQGDRLSADLAIGQQFPSGAPEVEALRASGRGSLLRASEMPIQEAVGRPSLGDPGRMNARAITAEPTPGTYAYRGTGQQRTAVQNTEDTLAARKAAATESETFRRELHEDQQRFAESQTASNQAFQRSQAEAAREATRAQAELNRTNKPASGAERTALKFYIRAAEANDDAEKVEDEIAKSGLMGQTQTALLPNVMQTKKQQMYRQAQRSFTEARLRKDSGAAIPDSEFVNDSQMYFVRPGDSPEVVDQKRRARARTLMAIGVESGRAFGEFYQDPEAEMSKWKSASGMTAATKRGNAPGGEQRVKVKGPNGESGTIPEGSALPPGWTIVRQ